MSETSTAFDNYNAANAFTSYAAEQRAQANMVTAIGATIGGVGGYLIAEQVRIGKPWMGAVALGLAGALFLRRQAQAGA